MNTVECGSTEWVDLVLQGLSYQGYCVVTEVLDEGLREETRGAMYRVQQQIRDHVGSERLTKAGELGVLRLMLRYDPHFFTLLELDPILQVVDATVSETAVLHLQNGLILPPLDLSVTTADIFQLRFHRDFPRVLNGYLISVNAFLAIDEFTEENGGTLLVPGTHQQALEPTEEYMQANAVPVVCPAGSMIVFDSTTWHAAGRNASARDRLAINHQFTRSYVKQQVDYVRALGDEVVLAQPPRTQQLLGWYTRVVTSLDEYYVPAEERLYRSGQG